MFQIFEQEFHQDQVKEENYDNLTPLILNNQIPQEGGNQYLQYQRFASNLRTQQSSQNQNQNQYQNESQPEYDAETRILSESNDLSDIYNLESDNQSQVIEEVQLLDEIFQVEKENPQDDLLELNSIIQDLEHIKKQLLVSNSQKLDLSQLGAMHQLSDKIKILIQNAEQQPIQENVYQSNNTQINEDIKDELEIKDNFQQITEQLTLQELQARHRDHGSQISQQIFQRINGEKEILCQNLSQLFNRIQLSTQQDQNIDNYPFREAESIYVNPSDDCSIKSRNLNFQFIDQNDFYKLDLDQKIAFMKTWLDYSLKNQSKLQQFLEEFNRFFTYFHSRCPLNINEEESIDEIILKKQCKSQYYYYGILVDESTVILQISFTNPPLEWNVNS